MSNASLPPGASSPRDHGRDGEHRREATRGPESADRHDTGREVRDDRPAPGTGGANSSTMALILHAVTFLCCANWLFGVAGIVFAVRAGQARDRGRPDQAETLTRYSWYCLGAAGVMFFVMMVLTFVALTQAGSWIGGIVPISNY